MSSKVAWPSYRACAFHRIDIIMATTKPGTCNLKDVFCLQQDDIILSKQYFQRAAQRSTCCLLSCPEVLHHLQDFKHTGVVREAYVVSLKPRKAPTATNMRTAAGHARALICRWGTASAYTAASGRSTASTHATLCTAIIGTHVMLAAQPEQKHIWQVTQRLAATLCIHAASAFRKGLESYCSYCRHMYSKCARSGGMHYKVAPSSQGLQVASMMEKA